LENSSYITKNAALLTAFDVARIGVPLNSACGPKAHAIFKGFDAETETLL
jgi:hypothetical protein